jgi:cytochrome d ubiquinol oxidase subunit II
MEIYAPLANRLGISWIKIELEELSFQYLHPREHAELVETLGKTQRSREKFIDDVTREISSVLKKSGMTSFEVSGRQYAGSTWDWLHPFVLAVGVGLVFGYVLLGATWLVMKTEGELQQWARRHALRASFGVLAFIVLVSVWTPFLHRHIAERWFSWPNMLYFMPVPVITAALALWLWRALRRGAEVVPFIAAMGLFLLCYLGLAISLFPYVVPHTLTLWDTATAPEGQAFLLIGTMFLIPVIFTYTGWSYWVFRGKVRADMGYH